MKYSPVRISAALERRWKRRRVARAFAGKRGLEIGGPSDVFSPSQPNPFFPPIYPLAESVDNCNYAANTMWSEGSAGSTFHSWSDVPAGRQLVQCATELSAIPDGSYDFLLASHVLEHVANPLKALREWRRVLKPGGYAFILLPERAHTFDHRRPVTTFEHLKQDFEQDTPESDLTHLDEILALHDLDRDKPAGTPEQFRERSLRNRDNRCLHHHVFDPPLIRKSLQAAGFVPLYIFQQIAPHIAVFCRAAKADGSLRN